MAYWIPAMGDDYRRQAVLAAQGLMSAIRDEHTGEFILPVGKVGGSGVEDFTALGDTVNTASRLQAECASGEVILSEEIYSAAASDFPDLEERVLALRGKDQPAPVRVLRP